MIGAGTNVTSSVMTSVGKPAAPSRPCLGARIHKPLNPLLDHVSGQYTSMADDDSLSGKQREAAMLVSVADGHLNEDEPKEALQSATSALEIFREIKDKKSVADTLRMIINAHRMDAEMAGEKPDFAVELARNEMGQFKAAGDKRGEACMLLSIAEVNGFSAVTSAAEEGADCAEEALMLFQDVDDKRMEGTAQLALLAIHFLRDRPKECMDAATAALDIFEDLGDEVGQGKALHGQALSHVPSGDLSAAVKKAQEAMRKFQSCGAQRDEAFECRVIAQWNVAMDKHGRAITAAKQALAIYREVKMSPGQEAFALYMLALAHQGKGNKTEALSVVENGVEHFRNKGNNKGVVLALEVMCYLHCAMGTPDDGVGYAKEALDLCKDDRDERSQIFVQHALGEAHLRRKEPDDAVCALEAAADIAHDLGDQAEEAFTQASIAYVYLSNPSLDSECKKALRASNEALSLYKEEGCEYGEANALHQISFAFASKGDFNKAVDNALESLEIYSEEGDATRESQLLTFVSDLYKQCGMLDEALKFAEQRRELWQNLENPREEASAMEGIAHIHLRAEELKDAEDMATTAKKAYHDLGDLMGECCCVILLIQIQVAMMAQDDVPSNLAKKDLPDSFTEIRDRAWRLVNDAMKLSGRIGDRCMRAQVLLHRANVLTWRSRARDALESAVQAEKMFQQAGMPTGEVQAGCLKAEMLHATGKQELAMETAEACLELAQKLDDRDCEEAANETLEKIRPKKQMQMQMVPMFEDFAQAQQGAAMPVQQAAAASAVAVEKAKPKGLDPALTKSKILNLVRDLVADSDDLLMDSALMESGMDSLSSVELATNVAKEFQMNLSPALMFDFPTVRALGDHIVEESMNMAY